MFGRPIVKMNLNRFEIIRRLKSFAFDFNKPIYRARLRFLLPEHRTVHSLLFLFSSFITLHLFVFGYNRLAILFFCSVWFLSMQCTGPDKGKLIHEILSGQKRKAYQEEIINIVQTRYLLANDSVNNYEWLNFFIRTKWAKSLIKVVGGKLLYLICTMYLSEYISTR